MAAKTKSTAPNRISFAKIREPQEVPNLLALQIESFDWLLGNDAWRARLGKNERPDRGEIPKTSGLEEIFEEISPIEDFQGSMSLSFRDHRFEPSKYTIAECKERDITYAAPLFLTAEFTNNVTGEIKSQTVFMGDFPLMTPRGTFVINGTERVVVSQLVRSPGVYFERTVEKASDKDIFTAKIIPSRGAWLEFEIDKKDFVAVRIDRKRKQSVTIFLKALGWSNDQILAEFGEYPSIKETLAKDNVSTQDEALLDIYRKMRPGEPPTKEAAQTLIENLYFNPKRYDLAKVGRFKVNKKLGLDLDLGKSLLAIDDIVGAIRYIAALHKGETLIDLGKQVRVEIDDIDHFGNRRLRTVGELIQNQVRVGLSRMERVVRERMTTQDVEAITPQTLINIRPITASIKEFFGTSQLSQFMDQTNPISGLTHKRRLSALGPGGLSRDRAGFEVRDVHPSHYGRMCPIETPEGPNIGLIGSLATYARITPFGFVETPYRKVSKGKVTDAVDYLTADEEDEHIIAQANAPLTEDSHFAEARVLVRRRGGEVEYIPAEEVDYMDVSPRQMVSVATAMIPFLEHDDANRALMGANMMRQAVPLLRAESPLVGTGMEYRAAVDAGDVLLAIRGGVVSEVASDLIVITTDDGEEDTYNVDKFIRSNQGTSRNMRVIVSQGQKIAAGQAIADGPSTELGEMALGKNLLVAFMSWEGHNYEDAIILSQRLVQDDVLSSIHIEEYEVDARDTKLGAEEITRDIPNVSEEVLADLDERGIIRIGADVVPGDILVGKVTPKGETELTPEERLLRAIFGEKAREVRDTSLKVPHGEGGKVIGVKIFDLDDGYDLAAGVNQVVRVYVAQKRKIQDGDKLAGRHGNKGVISKILPVEDMPFLADGTPVDVVLNPLGVPGRMNVGQVLETHLGWVAKSGWQVSGSDKGWQERLGAIGALSAEPGTRVATPVFDGAREEEITGLLGSTLPNADGDRLVGEHGKAMLFDGRTGQPYREPITVGYMYILKLHHLVDDKIHARSTGPYSMITQQPLGGKAQFGGQRFGEMEVWALEAYGAAYTLQELLTIKSDDVLGRVKVYEAIVKGENIPEPGIPESFKVLVKEMQSLCLNVEVLSSEGVAIEMRDTDEEVFKTAEELGINLSRVEPSSVEEV
ncbi:MAG: DNA-directed RNA polymerase subunit beta [Candidatus Nanopelagicales bacterium]|nr:DNA-directed RNA polymerase subunit beta [Candidatus Nanopelagicales bacterium]MDP4863987.1 DNA-directed RNA polymerase subunit beta [Candidatus Nanopelagicaceae bacterium]MDP4652840.1 DNA-directed RNA polymerase subunit beta [Candidatus Nanopelagicales bacterium]MDP4750661.1 DNA-directed RNA polymerase subunit beta [Candidatus Nanopelagicales bacterium]MDP4930688.1 DNA-directed RNA polymerase subunit beta [Candidatus Nanopelagicaceae bacterium]